MQYYLFSSYSVTFSSLKSADRFPGTDSVDRLPSLYQRIRGCGLPSPEQETVRFSPGVTSTISGGLEVKVRATLFSSGKVP